MSLKVPCPPETGLLCIRVLTILEFTTDQADLELRKIHLPLFPGIKGECYNPATLRVI